MRRDGLGAEKAEHISPLSLIVYPPLKRHFQIDVYFESQGGTSEKNKHVMVPTSERRPRRNEVLYIPIHDMLGSARLDSSSLPSRKALSTGREHVKCVVESTWSQTGQPARPKTDILREHTRYTCGSPVLGRDHLRGRLA